MRLALVHKTARRDSGLVQAMRDDHVRAASVDRGAEDPQIAATGDPAGLVERPIVARSFQRQPALMPTIRAAAENSDILETGSHQLRGRTRQAPVGLGVVSPNPRNFWIPWFGRIHSRGAVVERGTVRA
jgi:hypothetical protein